MKFVGYTTKGLEKIAEREICSIGATVVAIGDKRVIFASDADVAVMSSLRTIDDIGVLVAEAADIKDIQQLHQLVTKINFEEARLYLSHYRTLTDTFSQTISAAGSPIKTKEIASTLRDMIAKTYGWQFTPLDHTNFDIRIFIDHKDVIISVRVTAESLHHRIYKTMAKPGSLKPTIAAAMVQLATQSQSGLRVVDTFCGSGTILCESVVAGNEVYGSDIDADSVAITRHNLKMLDYIAEDTLLLQDAMKTKWHAGFFDCAISNLPWDKQVVVHSITNLYEGAIREYARILKPHGTLCVLISKPELFIKHAKKYFADKKIEQIKIGLLGQNPSIILISKFP